MKSRLQKEEGQSLVEMAVIVPFLAILLLGVIELAQAFTAYIVVINGARAGAAYASLYPELRNCANPPDTDASAIADLCHEYADRVKEETLAVGLNDNELTVLPPVMYSPNGTTVFANCPISGTASYHLVTFSSGMSLPLVGRMGLPNAYTILYTAQMPIREAEDQSTSCLSYNP